MVQIRRRAGVKRLREAAEDEAGRVADQEGVEWEAGDEEAVMRRWIKEARDQVGVGSGGRGSGGGAKRQGLALDLSVHQGLV